jgi:hypothetical protein
MTGANARAMIAMDAAVQARYGHLRSLRLTMPPRPVPDRCTSRETRR